MCPFEDNMPIYFGGDDSKPAAYVEVNVFGRSVPGSAWEKLTEQIMAALGKELGIPAERRLQGLGSNQMAALKAALS